jgi:beta-lactamase superfamily II metal-dependent hydrolase
MMLRRRLDPPKETPALMNANSRNATKKSRRPLIATALAAAVFAACPMVRAAQGGDHGQLQIYFIDVEGGQSTLFVTPDKHSLLIDTGWPGNSSRDASRIADAAKQAGVSKIDYVLLTHYHVDHTGGVPQLVEKIPVGTFIDHGPLREPGDKATADAYAAYQKVLASGKYHHLVAHAGDVLPIPGMHIKVISADGNLIKTPLPGGGEADTYCAKSEKRPADQTENARSVGLEITFGKLRILDLGDLTWDKEMDLLCPKNVIGHVDLLIVSHHGWYQSSSPALVDAVHPRVAIMDNGAKKGGSKPTVERIRAIPGLEAEYQLHYSDEAGSDNPPEKFIANVQGPDTGYGIHVTADANGTITVENDRTKASASYSPRGSSAGSMGGR